MKNSAVFLIFLLSLKMGLAAETVIELRGVLSEAGAVRLSLSDRTTDTTRWIEVGQSFAGFKVLSYDQTAETVTLNKDGADLRVRLSSSQIKPAIPSAAASLTTIEEIQKAVANNLRQISYAADQYFMETGRRSVALSELVGPDKYIKELNAIDGESYAGMQLKAGADVSVSTLRGLTVSFPEKPSGSYATKSGDTASKIAALHQLTVKELQALNPDVEWSRLKVGQTLKVK